MKKLNYSKIREMDIALTVDRGLFPYVIRIVEIWKRHGLRKAFKLRHSLNIPNHVFFFVRRENGLLQACEMKPRGIRVNSIKKNYLTGKWSKPKILEVRRFPAYSMPSVRRIANERLLAHYSMSITGKNEMKYDWRALGAFLNISKENPKRRICSGLVVWETSFDGVKWKTLQSDSNTPYDLMVEGNSFEVQNVFCD